MELHQVRYVMALVDAGNFTRAAERCRVSQPALTAGVKKLEQELGGPLFVRDRAGARLTTLGELLLPRFRRLADDASSVGQIAERYRDVETAPLRVGVLNTIGPTRLADVLAEFRRRAPGADLELRVLGREDLLRELEEANVEVALAAELVDLPEWLVIRRLYREGFVIVLPPTHPLQSNAEVCLGELHQQPYIDRTACELRTTVAKECSKRGIDLHTTYRTAHDPWVESMVVRGLGFAFMPEYSLVHPMSIRRPIADLEVFRHVALWRSVDHPRTPVGRRFWTALTEAWAEPGS